MVKQEDKTIVGQEDIIFTTEIHFTCVKLFHKLFNFCIHCITGLIDIKYPVNDKKIFHKIYDKIL